jgi:hypothetical protein
MTEIASLSLSMTKRAQSYTQFVKLVWGCGNNFSSIAPVFIPLAFKRKGSIY